MSRKNFVRIINFSRNKSFSTKESSNGNVESYPCLFTGSLRVSYANESVMRFFQNFDFTKEKKKTFAFKSKIDRYLFESF
jgi:hypothetical protein